MNQIHLISSAWRITESNLKWMARNSGFDDGECQISRWVKTLFKVDPTYSGAFSFDDERANRFINKNPQKAAGKFEMITLDTF